MSVYIVDISRRYYHSKGWSLEGQNTYHARSLFGTQQRQTNIHIQ